MSNARRRIFGLAAGVMVSTFAGESSALDRFLNVFQSAGIPVTVAPSNDTRVEFSFGVAYFLTERWALSLTVDLGVGEPERAGLGTGVLAYLLRDGNWLPFLTLEFLYLLDPTNDVGVRAAAGLEWNARVLTGVDNLRLFLKTGGGVILRRNASDEVSVNAATLGLLYTF